MQPFTTLTSPAVPLDIVNVDTDQIIPARFLGRPREAQTSALFHDLRFDADGRPVDGFVLNRPGHADARILVANRNFGCGSSRENAVTALVDNGFRAFIAPSFGDIFFSNCYQNGALPIVLPEERVQVLLRILEERPGATITVDLPAQSVTGPDGQVDRFATDPFRKACLIDGTDDIGLTLGYRAQVEAFEARRRDDLPWL